MPHARYSFTMQVLLVVAAILTLCPVGVTQELPRREEAWRPEVPVTWDQEAIDTLEVPLPHPGVSPRHLRQTAYEALPARKIYRTYPVYVPGREPEGYWESLHHKEPEIVFDASQLKTRSDWVAAGRLIFDDGNELSVGSELRAFRDPEYYRTVPIPSTPEGINPFARYVVREKGKVELGTDACSTCHTRVLPDGRVIIGGPSSFPLGETIAYELQRALDEGGIEAKRFRITESESEYRQFASPWLGAQDPARGVLGMGLAELRELWASFPAGVHPRERSGYFHPTKVPDLNGVQARRYLDASGLVRHRSLGDLMRYAALNQGGDEFSSFGDLQVATLEDADEPVERYSDEQLYALALFVYSLEAPAPPPGDPAAIARGEAVFREESCHRCHSGPDFSSHELFPVDGFEPPTEHLEQFHVRNIHIGTDSGLTLRTRRGTGYYKVPSLRGLWYRGPFFHDGSLATLEDVFDPRRLEDDYVPTGFRGYQIERRAITGHEYGLELDDVELADLLAYLRSL